MTEEIVNEEVEDTDEGDDILEDEKVENEKSVEDLIKEVEGLKAGIAAEREKRQQEADQRAFMEQQLILAQQQKITEPAEKTTIDKIAEMDDNEPIFAGEVKNAFREFKQELAMLNDKTTAETAISRIAQQDPNYEQKIADNIAEIFAENPKIKQRMNRLPFHERVDYAYELVSERLERKERDKVKEKNDKISKNSKKVKSVSSVSSASGGVKTQFDSMSDDEFAKHVADMARKAV